MQKVISIEILRVSNKEYQKCLKCENFVRTIASSMLGVYETQDMFLQCKSMCATTREIRQAACPSLPARDISPEESESKLMTTESMSGFVRRGS